MVTSSGNEKDHLLIITDVFNLKIYLSTESAGEAVMEVVMDEEKSDKVEENTFTLCDLMAEAEVGAANLSCGRARSRVIGQVHM